MPLALISLCLASFCVGTTEFMVAGLLPSISIDFGVPIAVAGLLVSGYAIGVAIGGPIITLMLSSWQRKNAILATMAIFIVGHVWCAIAPSYFWLLLGRIVISLSHGTFYGIAVIVAVGLVPAERSGRAVSLIFAAITVASIIGVPAGTAIGNFWGWRGTFWVLTCLSGLFVLALAVSLPGHANDRKTGPGVGAQIRALGSQKVYLSFCLIIAMTMAFWSFYTFVSPFLSTVSGVPKAKLPLVLMTFGFGATLGALLGGRLADLWPRRTLLLVFPLQALLYALIAIAPGNGVAAGFELFALGALYFLPNAALTKRILEGASRAPDLAATMLSTVFNIGIASGAFVGANAIGHNFPLLELPWIGAGMATIASAVSLATLLLDHRFIAEVA